MLSSPLAAASRARVFHRRTRQRPRERGLRTLAMLGALVLHLLFLFGFVLGPAYQPKMPHESKAQFLQVRLVEPPEPPPPPPVRGTPPKEHGPRHQGRHSAANTSEPGADAESTQATQSVPKPVRPVVAKPVKASAKVAKPVAARKPPATLPKPAPTPELQPIPLAVESPAIQLPAPALQPPVPPKFQPELVRKPQREGNQAMRPQPSLAMPEVPPQAAPPVAPPSMALSIEVPRSNQSPSIKLAPAKLSAAPPVPALQPVPLPAQPALSVDLQTPVMAPAAVAPQQKARIQPPTVEVSEAELAAVPITPAESADMQPQAPAVEIDIADAAPEPTIAAAIAPPQLNAPATQPEVSPAPSPTASEPAKSATQNMQQKPATSEITPASGDVATGRDVSKAPDATPQGDDNARPGKPDGVAESQSSALNSTARQPAAGQAGHNGDNGKGKQRAAGQPGGNQPGADQGKKQGAIGDYVQLKPHGDTDIMSHGRPDIGYKATRFEQDWTPEGESSIDTALRHAVEKTTVGRTFHLPRGVRIKCEVKPLLPLALFGCHNPDPPPKPVDAKVYERLDLAPAAPLVPPEPAASVVGPAPMAPVDNSAECSAARVSGAPSPPGCQSLAPPVRRAPASSSSSWVPASDQFH